MAGCQHLPPNHTFFIVPELFQNWFAEYFLSNEFLKSSSIANNRNNVWLGVPKVAIQQYTFLQILIF